VRFVEGEDGIWDGMGWDIGIGDGGWWMEIERTDGMRWDGVSWEILFSLYKRVSPVLATLALVLAGSCSETSALLGYGIGWRFD